MPDASVRIPSREGESILIVDDDPAICDFLKNVFSNWGIEAETLSNPSQVIDQMKARFYNLVLLDIVMPEMSGLDLIPKIVEHSRDTKIIMMSGYTDKESAIQALRLGTFDFLEKPFDLTLLAHSVNRALRAQRAELDVRKIYGDLERSRDEILAHKVRLEDLNRQLMETNRAMSVLAQNIERTRRETEKGIVLKVRSLIVPIIEKLQRSESLEGYQPELRMLITHVADLTSGLTVDTKIVTTLSSTELRIASLIKGGLTTEEIADHLCISTSTVKTHRRNIRKKLDINNSGQNLRSFLRSHLEDEDTEIQNL